VDDAQHDLVGHHFAPTEVSVHGPGEIGAPGDMITQHVFHHDARDVEVAAIRAPYVPLPAPGGPIISIRICRLPAPTSLRADRSCAGSTGSARLAADAPAEQGFW
jgi:hypothetical protein